MQSCQIKNAQIVWAYSPQEGLLTDSTLTNHLEGGINESVRTTYYSSFSHFTRSVSQGDPFLLGDSEKILVINDFPYLMKLLQPCANIYTLGFSMDSKMRVQLDFFANTLYRGTDAVPFAGVVEEAFKDFTCWTHTGTNLSLYNHILETHDKQVFFEFFNTFKYKIKNRKVLELLVYKFFIGEIDSDQLKRGLQEIEATLTKGQVVLFQPVKDFLESPLAGYLLQCVRERDREKVVQLLAEHRLDYFDVNYLKSFLQTYLARQEEHTQKMEAKAKAGESGKSTSGQVSYKKFDNKGNLLNTANSKVPQRQKTQ